ncbi:unnamed protein product [Lymnaea stagnalis]|uniref:BPTI/Kunitz inhibitor domain-containing protein n=1 Tax=Lymnaea stagnalis TaxID=6523 RepID=A0AAV2IE00_LYMST
MNKTAVFCFHAAPGCWCQGGVDQSASSYTSNLLPSLSRRQGRGGGAGTGPGVGGFDDFGNPIGGGFAGARGTGGQGHHVNRCGHVAPECLATPLDKYPECKYTYDVALGGCVKIDVSTACGFVSGGAGNLFNTVIECERYCL